MARSPRGEDSSEGEGAHTEAAAPREAAAREIRMSREETDAIACRSCGAEIVFLRTASGNKTPVNAETVEPGDVDYEPGRHVSHFSTCPQASAWRNRGK
jgi:hypothetical protein